MATLDAALALAQGHHAPVRVGEDLNLDVPRPLEILLEVHLAGAERLERLAAGRLERRPQLPLLTHEPHPLPSAPRRRLEQHRVAEPCGLGARLHHAAQRLGRAGDDGHPGRLHAAARGGLVTHGADRLGRRPDEHEARRGHRLGEGRPLGEEPVAGVERLALSRPGGGDQLRDIEVRFGRRRGAERHRSVGSPDVRGEAVGLGVDRDRLEPLLVTGADDAERDFAPVGDEDAFERRHQTSDLRHQW